jgi:putative peptidoglycan binding protein
MKRHFIGRLRIAILAAALPFVAQTTWAHGMGGGGGFHGGGGGFHSSGGFHSGSHNFALHHDGDRFHHDGDRFHRHHFFDDRFFFGFSYPFYGYPYYDYPYDYGYYDYSGESYNSQYWSDLTGAVQTELARAGYYHGAIDGVFGPDTAHAIRAYRKAKGLPVTGQIDRTLLKSLDI